MLRHCPLFQFPASRAIWAALFSLALCALAGCGPSSSTVTGKVMLDGRPLATGSITFIPEDGQTATAGDVIKDGAYSVSTPPGKKRVEITATKVVGKIPAYAGDPNSPMMDDVRPIQFIAKSPLTVDVGPGANQQDFELESAQ